MLIKLFIIYFVERFKEMVICGVGLLALKSYTGQQASNIFFFYDESYHLQILMLIMHGTEIDFFFFFLWLL